MEKGTVKHWNYIKGYGFVTVDDHMKEDIYFHISESLYRNIKVGDRVTFKVAKSRNRPGTLIAVDMKLIELL